MSTGLHAARATGLTVAEREESFTRTESEARWSREGRAAYVAEREALLFDFFSFDRCKVFQSGRKLLLETGRGFFFLSEIFGFMSIVFAVLLCRAVLSLSYIQHIKRRK